MKPSNFLKALLCSLSLLTTAGVAHSQSQVEVRRAQASADDEAPVVERVPQATAVQPAVKPAPRPTAPATSSFASTGGGSNYRLRPNDQLDIRVFGHQDLSGLTTVREDGTVRLQLINEVVEVGGSNLEAVESRIRALLAKDYLVDPRVSVNIYKHSVMKIAVLGKVNAPKTYAVPSNQPINLVQAIGLAGGRSNLGNLSKVSLKRGNRVQIYDVQEMMRNTDAPAVELQDGDVVEVRESFL